jgi:hypothetical protein
MFILFIVIKNLVIKPVFKRLGIRNGTEYNINGVEYFKFGLHQLQNWGQMLQKQPASATYLGNFTKVTNSGRYALEVLQLKITVAKSCSLTYKCFIL